MILQLQIKQFNCTVENVKKTQKKTNTRAKIVVKRRKGLPLMSKLKLEVPLGSRVLEVITWVT